MILWFLLYDLQSQLLEGREGGGVKKPKCRCIVEVQFEGVDVMIFG